MNHSIADSTCSFIKVLILIGISVLQVTLDKSPLGVSRVDDVHTTSPVSTLRGFPYRPKIDYICHC